VHDKYIIVSYPNLGARLCMHVLVSSSDCTGTDRSTSYYAVVCTSVLVSFPDFVARGQGTGSVGTYRLWERGQGEPYMMHSRADASCCHIESQSVCDYFGE